MKKRFFLYAVMCISLLPITVFSQDDVDHGRVAIQSEIHLFSMADLMGIGNGYIEFYDMPVEIGLRAYFGKIVGMDALFGFNFNSGFDRDSLTNTSKVPSNFSFSTRIGMVIRIVKGRSAELSLVPSYSMILQKNNISVSGGIGPTKYTDYISFTSDIKLGIEPSVNLSENFSLFSNLGFRITILPNSKYVNTSSPDFNFQNNVFPLKSRSDRSVSLGFYGLAIGMRYYF